MPDTGPSLAALLNSLADQMTTDIAALTADVSTARALATRVNALGAPPVSGQSPDGTDIVPAASGTQPKVTDKNNNVWSFTTALYGGNHGNKVTFNGAISVYGGNHLQINHGGNAYVHDPARGGVTVVGSWDLIVDNSTSAVDTVGAP